MEVKFTDENFSTEVINAKGLAVVDFYADWCVPCKMMAPIIEALSEQFSDVKIGKLNIDNNNKTAEKYHVMSIPTILFIKDGNVVETFVGAVSKDKLENKIAEYK